MTLAEQQRAFAAHLRDPERVPAPAGIEPRRLDIYRELFFNNLVDLLGGSFPVARRVLGNDRWRRLVREFYASHRAQTPYFLELPGEFVEWQAKRTVRAADEPPFLPELLHYEWVELALAVREEGLPDAVDAGDSDRLDLPLMVSPLAWPLAYRWPVHRLGPDYQPAEPPAAPTFLVVYRNREDAVQFLEIGAETAGLLEALDQAPGLSGRQALQRAARAAGEAEPAARAAIDDLIRRGVLLITREIGGIAT